MKNWLLTVKRGDLVVFMGYGGHEIELLRAKRYLEVGQVYRVTKLDMGNWYTHLDLDGVEPGSFNSAMFEPVTNGLARALEKARRK